MALSKVAHNIPIETVEKGNKILIDKTPLNKTKSNFLEFLRTIGLCRRFDKIDPSLMAVHPGNRGNIMCQGIDMQKKGEAIMNVGVETPTGGLAVELCSIRGDPLREQYLDANKRMISRSNGYIAPLTGHEAFLSLATSNCFQFARAVKAGCPTPCESLKNGAGCLSADMLQERDANMREFISGWPVEVIQWPAEIAWPQFPYILQKAANADHAVGGAHGEAETLIGMLRDVDGGASWSDATREARKTTTVPESLQGLACIGEFFGPTLGLRLVQKFENFRASLGAEIKLGNDLLTAIGSVQFKGTTSKYAYSRLGFWVTLAVSKEVVDGFAKNLTQSNINQYAKLSERGIADEIEAKMALLDGWLLTMEANWQISEEASNDIFFKALNRATLLACGKSGTGFEATKYASLGEVWGTAAAEMAAAAEATGPPAAKRFSPCTWAPFKPLAAEATGAAKPEAEPATFDFLNDPLSSVRAKGYRESAFVIEKGAGCTYLNNVYEIISLSTKGVQIQKRTAGVAPKFRTSIDVSTLLSRFQPISSTVKLPVTIDVDATRDTIITSKQSAVVADLAKCAVFEAITRISDSQRGSEQPLLKYMVNPRKLFVTEPFKKGELKIAPKGVLSAVSAIHDSKASPYTADCEVKQGDALMKFRVQPPKTTTDSDPSKWKDAVLEAFW